MLLYLLKIYYQTLKKRHEIFVSGNFDCLLENTKKYFLSVVLHRQLQTFVLSTFRSHQSLLDNLHKKKCKNCKYLLEYAKGFQV